ncbi:MAG TPA: discoidin domain-containing protein [Cyclobacteriaceae bacterium]|nr:discoidin domain-containing protein [Cyclobacteriaceae bacterium]
MDCWNPATTLGTFFPTTEAESEPEVGNQHWQKFCDAPCGGHEKVKKRFLGIAIFLSIVSHSIITIAQPGVTTQHNNHDRSGWYPNEKILNTNNVKLGSFGKLFSLAVDDQTYSQPLVALRVPMAAGPRNVVYVATVNNSVYAFDADSASGAYWHVNLTQPDSRPVKNTDMSGACDGFYRDYSGNIGIVGTPVIDTLTNTIYLVARSRNNTSGTYQQFLHALDITTGQEKAGSPKLIAAQVNGNGEGSQGGKLNFDPFKQNQRSGLLLLNGIVYITWASHCTWGPYHGWMLGYDKESLEQKIVYCTTPEGKEGGIWMAGGGPAADADGNIYLAVGNGTPGLGSNISDPINRGESTLKLTPSNGTLTVSSFFSPKDVERLVAADLDLGVTGMLLIPNTTRAMTGSKDGKIYVVDRNNMGGFNPTTDASLQVIDLGSTAHLRSSFAYYKGLEQEYVYSWSENGLLRAFRYDRGTNLIDMNGSLSSGVQGPIGNTGAFLSVSSNGSDDGSAILWASHAANGDANQSVRPGILHAFSASDVTKEIWNSSKSAADSPGNFAKFSCPTIANGKVYLASFSNMLNVYGLTGKTLATTCTGENIASKKTAVATTQEAEQFPITNAFDGDTTTRWSSSKSDNEYMYVDLGGRFDLCGVRIKWEDAYGKDFLIQVSEDAESWTTLVNIKENTSLENELLLNGTGRYVKMQGVKRGTIYGYSIFEFEVYGSPTTSACATPSGLNVTNIYGTSATLNWNANGLTEFNVQFKTVSAEAWNTVKVSAPTLELTTLACSSDYLFAVQGVCNATTTSDFSATTSFSTLLCDANCAPLPTRWNTQDIGDINFAGSACYSDGVFTLSASGNDIWDYSDGFRYTYRTITGDGEVLARVVEMDSANAWNKCGVMIRESLAPGSRHAMVIISSQNGAAFQYRASTDGLTGEEKVQGGISEPYWVKLVKAGSTFTGFISPDGIEWTQLGNPVDVGFGTNTPVYAGIALTSHNINMLTHAKVDSYLFSGLLDVELQHFTATVNLENTVDLAWTTTLENEIQSFTVERSADNLHYNDIDTVAAKNDGNITLAYTSKDAKPPEGFIYYRLRITATDGRVSYSAPVALSFMVGVGDTKEGLPVVYPNPSKARLYVKRGEEEIKMITMYDPAGKMVTHLEGDLEETTEIPVWMMANGIYVVEVRTRERVYRDKVVIRN